MVVLCAGLGAKLETCVGNGYWVSWISMWNRWWGWRWRHFRSHAQSAFCADFCCEIVQQDFAQVQKNVMYLLVVERVM